MPVRCRPRFSSRNRRFPDRCRSPDCASTAFRCRCLLLRQKLFVLPCRRLRNNYTPCPTGTPTFAALRRQRRDLIIAKNDQRTTPYPRCCQRQRRSGLFRAPARAFLLSPTAPFLPTAEEMGERTPAETAFLHFLSALCLFAAARAFPHVTGVFLIVVVPPTVPAQLSAAATCYSGKNYSFCRVAG